MQSAECAEYETTFFLSKQEENPPTDYIKKRKSLCIWKKRRNTLGYII
jgi:hypothetical protein